MLCGEEILCAPPDVNIICRKLVKVYEGVSVFLMSDLTPYLKLIPLAEQKCSCCFTQMFNVSICVVEMSIVAL